MDEDARQKAVEIFLGERDELVAKRERLLHLKRALAVYTAEIDDQLKDCVAGGRALDADVRLPDWNAVLRTSLEQEMERATGVLNWTRPTLGARKMYDDQGLIYEILGRVNEGALRRTVLAPRRVLRDFILESLAAVAPKGLKIADIRAAAENIGRGHLNPKSYGMTLYRLKKEGLARREGRLWRSVWPTNDYSRHQADNEKDVPVLSEDAQVLDLAGKAIAPKFDDPVISPSNPIKG